MERDSSFFDTKERKGTKSDKDGLTVKRSSSLTDHSNRSLEEVKSDMKEKVPEHTYCKNLEVDCAV